MNQFRKDHWDHVYEVKSDEEVSWTQEVPATSLEMISSMQLPKSSSIIDVGGGNSRLVDCLLDEGYTNITVLDISEAALHKTRQRLGDRSGAVRWIVSDILDFRPDEGYDLWHDRATFHFLTMPADIGHYIATVSQYVRGYLMLATFAEDGPGKCSGLPVSRYSEQLLCDAFDQSFEKIICRKVQHTTPFDTLQSFLFCSFRKRPG